MISKQRRRCENSEFKIFGQNSCKICNPVEVITVPCYDTERRMHEAIELHVKGLLEDGLPVPRAPASAAFVAVQ